MLRARQKLGKYRIEGRLASGPFADVYRAMDTIEGLRVALKIPNQHAHDRDFLRDFRREVRLAAALKHPHILPIKDASVIGDRFVIATPLGDETLADRLTRRLSIAMALSFAEQMLSAAAFAHQHRVLHCDIKPENLVLFGNQLQLADFGIARTAVRTVKASGSGTLGYLAPEQAMGRPSYRSDVFSLGLVIYRMLAGALPEWPFDWPPAGIERLRRHASPELMDLLRRSIALSPSGRPRDAGQMLRQFRTTKRRRRRAARATRTRPVAQNRHWRDVRYRQFQNRFGKALETRHRCDKCNGPVSEAMQTCPWCGKHRKIHRSATQFPAHCPRCKRGVKLDWDYCAWCYGTGFEPETNREYSDRRYAARCAGKRCTRRLLMPFMRYCPWCRTRVARRWKITGSRDTCTHCHWGVVREFWRYCPWCTRSLRRS